MSRWSNWSRGSKPGLSLSGFLAEGPVDQLRTGNPTGNGTLQPADRAKQLGLQSDGKGGYIDPKTGQVVARTVNNELVFYSTGPTGGAVSDGSGGAAMATPSSAWQDPVTGMMITPPSKAETPNEIAAIPDSVPAMAPAGYNEFMQSKKQQQYFDDFVARENAKIQAQMPQQPMAAPETDPGAIMQPADPAMAPQPEMPMENYLGPDLFKRSGGMGPPTFSALRDLHKRSQTVSQQPPDEQEGGGPAPEPQPEPQQPTGPNFMQGIDPAGLPGGRAAFPAHNLDMLHQLASRTQKQGNMSQLLGLDSVGAGTDTSRVGELMSMAMATLPPEQRALFMDNIRAHASGQDDSFFDMGWLDAANKNATAADRLRDFRFRHLPPEERPHVSGSAWDVEDDLRAIGIEPGDKGVSTDYALQYSNGDTEQVSLKKDWQNRLLNQQATAFPRWFMNGVAQDENHPMHKHVAEIRDNLSKIKEFAKNHDVEIADLDLNTPLSDIKAKFAGKRDDNNRAVGPQVERLIKNITEAKSMFDTVDPRIDNQNFIDNDIKRTDDLFQQAYADGEYNEISNDQFDRSPRQIYEDVISGSAAMSEYDPENNPVHKLVQDKYFTEAGTVRGKAQRTNPGSRNRVKIDGETLTDDQWKDYTDMMERMEQRYEDYTSASEENKTYEKIRKVIDKSGHSLKDVIDQVAAGSLTGDFLGQSGLKGEKLQKLARKIKLVAAKASKNGGNITKEYRKALKQYRDDFVDVLENNKAFRDGTMANINEYFPLRDIAEGKETMIVGDQIVNKDVLKELFGTDNWDEISPNLRIQGQGAGKDPLLSYIQPRQGDAELTTANGIPLAQIELNSGNVGIGGTMKYQMTPAKAFAERIAQAQRIFDPEQVQEAVEAVSNVMRKTLTEFMSML